MQEFVVKMASAGLDPLGVVGRLLDSEARVEQYDSQRPLAEQVSEANVLLTRDVPVTPEAIRAATGLRLIQRPGVRTFDVDLEFAASVGVPVCNIPKHLLPDEEVGEHAACLMLALAKRLPLAQETMAERRKVSEPSNMRLAGRWLGLVGAGRTAKPLMAVARALQMKVALVKRTVGPEVLDELRPDWLGTPEQLPELLRMADIVSMHVPLNVETRGMVGEAELAMMRPGALLINIARAPVVDHAAVREAVFSGHLGGFAADVWWDEPARADDDLVDHPAVIATPHVASAAVEGQERLYGLVVDNIRRVMQGEEPEHRVNMAG